MTENSAPKSAWYAQYDAWAARNFKRALGWFALQLVFIATLWVLADTLSAPVYAFFLGALCVIGFPLATGIILLRR